MPALVTTAYFPPVEWFAAIARDIHPVPGNTRTGFFYLVACENYQKQSWRNRCMFYGSEGPQTLSFPIIHRNGTHNGIPIKEIEIDWSTPWLQQHEKAIVSAYKTSAFFDYYRDELFSTMEMRPARLFDFNLSIIRFFLSKLGLPLECRLTEDFMTIVPEGVEDLREVVHPKRQNHILSSLGLEKPYFQVFSGKYGFIPNMSVMDLLFNEGPDSVSWIVRI